MIYEGKRYGIFSTEVDSVVALVHQGAERANIEAITCPKCASNLRVSFWPDGRHFIVTCDGAIPHHSQAQEISLPPVWWKDCLYEVTEWMVSKKDRA